MAGMFQRAREESMQQGIEQGRAEGERALLRRLLRLRFGVLPPEAAERVRAT